VTGDARQGYAQAQYELGIANLYGFAGVNKDPAKAIDLFLKAANQGHAEAQWQLGLIYEHGGGLGFDYPKDYDKARYY
jgi:TPR repeat protein